ncbi:MAG TPA: hypothetical protein VGN57_09265 [Pirellulaceae bacterium]|jgi:hypothetical protein|nr:hypothetical protein [Pirellulaceae bacterium]
MSNERPGSADDSAFSAEERPAFARDRRVERAAEDAINSAFAARLADVAPRSGVDASVLHYEAGRAAAVAEFRRERSLYRGIACGSAAMVTLTLGLWGWQLGSAPFASPEDQAVAVQPSEAKPSVAVVADTSDDERQSTPEPTLDRSDRPQASTVAKRRFAEPIDFDRLANFDRGDSMRWRDVYHLSPRSNSFISEPVSTPNPSPPEANAPAPWSAFPSPRRMHDLIQEGI